jgi:hypothetical protein
MIRSGNGGEFKVDSIVTYLRDSLGFAIGSGGGGGVTQINTSSPLTGGPITSTGTIGIQEAATNQSGYLSSTNFTAFNNKLGYNGLSNRVAVWNATGLTYNNFSSVGNNLGLGTISPATWITNGRGLAIMDSTATTQTTNLNFINRTSNNYHWWQMYTQRTGNTAGRFALWSDAGGGSDKFTIDYTTFQPGFRYLQGTGSRMVVADGNGLLSSMAIPATGPTYTEGDGIDITSNVIKVQHFGDGLSVNSSGISLNAYMQNIASNAGTGIMVRTSGGATGGSAYRTLTQGTGISIANGNGVSGNPTITNLLPFSPSSAGTTDYVLTKTSGGYDWLASAGAVTSTNGQFGRSSNQTFTNTTASAQTIDFNSNSIVGGSSQFTVSNGVITIVQSGTYYISTTASIYSESTSGTYNLLGIYSGSTPLYSSFQNLEINRQTSISVGGILRNIPANYTVNVKVGTNTSNAYNMTVTNPYLSIIKIQ